MKNDKLTGGIALIIMGIFLFLRNLGYIDFNILTSIFDLWPLILVVVGINILFKKKTIVSFITWTMFFIILILYGVFYENIDMYNLSGSSNAELVDQNINIDKDTKTFYGELQLDIGASKLNIGPEEEKLVSVNLKGEKLIYRESYENNKEKVILDFEDKGNIITGLNNKGSNYDFNINKDVIWDLDLDLGAVSGKLDFTEIPIRSIDLDLGAADLDIILGNRYEKSYIDIDSGASNLSIEIPGNVGIKIKLDGALTKTNIDDLNLNRSGDYYVSSNYEEANTKLEFDIDMGAGKIDFKTN